MDIDDSNLIPIAPEAPSSSGPPRKGRRSMQNHEVNYLSTSLNTDIYNKNIENEKEQVEAVTEGISSPNNNSKQGWGNEDSNTEKSKRNRVGEIDIDDSKR